MDKIIKRLVRPVLELKLNYHARICREHNGYSSFGICRCVQRDDHLRGGQPLARNRRSRDSNLDRKSCKETLLVTIPSLKEKAERVARLLLSLPRLSIARYALYGILTGLLYVTLPHSVYAIEPCLDNTSGATASYGSQIQNMNSYYSPDGSNNPSRTTAVYVPQDNCSFTNATAIVYSSAVATDTVSTTFNMEIWEITGTSSTDTSPLGSLGELIDTSDTVTYFYATTTGELEFRFSPLVYLESGKIYQFVINPMETWTTHSGQIVNWAGQNTATPWYTTQYYRDYTLLGYCDLVEPIDHCVTGSGLGVDYYNDPSAVRRLRLDYGQAGTGEHGFLLEIDQVQYNTFDGAYGVYDCYTNNDFPFTVGCWSSTTVKSIGIDWTFSTLTSDSHLYVDTRVLDYDTGAIPFGQDSSLYYTRTDLSGYTGYGTDWYLLGLVDISTTTFQAVPDVYTIMACASPSDFFEGIYDCAEMVFCNGVDGQAECTELASVVLYGAPILNNRPESCNLTDILCNLERAFIPDRSFMSGLVQQASTTVMAVWPVGYLTREFYAYNEATGTEFVIPLDMSQFGLPTTTASINLNDAVGGVVGLSTEIDDLVDLLENIMWAMFWLLLAYRIYNGRKTVHQLSES